MDYFGLKPGWPIRNTKNVAYGPRNVAKMWHLRAKIWQKMWQILKCTFFALGWDVAVPIGTAAKIFFNHALFS
jgi:hypothetical protein